MAKIKKAVHYCATPATGVTWRCPECGAMFQWRTTERTDRHGRPLKQGGSWIMVSGGKR